MSSDQIRIGQLVSPYSPSQPPQLPLIFGDYLSILWRLDQSAGRAGRETYYRQCANALARGLGFENRSIYRLVKTLTAGEICGSIQNSPYRGTARLVDAQDRRDAIRELMEMRGHILAMGEGRLKRTVGWPGSRMTNVELRERLFAVFFTAFDGQFRHFSRLLLVVDIVLEEMLLGQIEMREVSLIKLINELGYPDPDKAATRSLFDDRPSWLES